MRQTRRGACSRGGTLRNSMIGLLGWLAVVFLAAGVAAVHGPGIWYDGLVKPPLNPPDIAFPIVWNILYVMMALAAWLIWRECGFRLACRCMGMFFAQLIFNAAWMWIFFGLKQPGWALAEILALWVLILLTTIGFWRRHRLAGLLMIPYLLWVGFAAWLNYGLWRLNG